MMQLLFQQPPCPFVYKVAANIEQALAMREIIALILQGAQLTWQPPTTEGPDTVQLVCPRAWCPPAPHWKGLLCIGPWHPNGKIPRETVLGFLQLVNYRNTHRKRKTATSHVTPCQKRLTTLSMPSCLKGNS